MTRDPFNGFLSLHSSVAEQNPLYVYASFPVTVISCPVSRSEQYTEALKLLNTFSTLENNWDGYGGARISEQVVDHARTLLCTQLYTQSRLAPPEITPTPNGTLVIEWLGCKGEAAVEIGNTRVSGVIKAEHSPTICIAGETARLSEYLPSFKHRAAPQS